MADDKTTLAYWMRQTGGRKNAAYTLKKEYTNAIAGRGKARTFKPIATSEMSVPRGYQYSPSTYKAPKGSTVSGPNVGYKNPRDMAGKTNFKGTTGDKVKLGAAIVGGFAAVPAAVIAAPFVAGAVAASIGTASAIGAKASGVLSRGAGAVSKGARSAASPWVASTVKPVSRVPKRVVKPKVPKPKVPKPTNPTAAMDYPTGALGGQSARMGSRSAPAAAKAATRKAATVAKPKVAARVPKRVTKPTSGNISGERGAAKTARFNARNNDSVGQRSVEPPRRS